MIITYTFHETVFKRHHHGKWSAVVSSMHFNLPAAFPWCKVPFEAIPILWIYLPKPYPYGILQICVVVFFFINMYQSFLKTNGAYYQVSIEYTVGKLDSLGTYLITL